MKDCCLHIVAAISLLLASGVTTVLSAQSAGAAADPVRSWVTQLKDPSPAVRFAAAYSLEDLGSEIDASIGGLIEALADADPYVRGRAASALGEHPRHSVRAIPALLRVLREPERDVRERVLISLAKLGEPVIPALLDALDDQQTVVDPSRVGRHGQTQVFLSDYAVWALARIGHAAVGPVLDRIRVRESGAEPRIDQSRSLGGLLVGSGSRLERLAVAMVERCGEPCVPTLMGALADQHAGVRMVAARGLGAIGLSARGAVTALEARLGTATQRDRLLVIEALGRIGGPAEAALGRAVLDGRDREVRLAAARELTYESPAMVAILARALSDPDAEVRAASGYALAEIFIAAHRRGRAVRPDDRSAAIAALIRAMTDAVVIVRNRAAYALEWILEEPRDGDERLALVLARAVRDADMEQEHVAGALEHLGARAAEALPALFAAVREETGDGEQRAYVRERYVRAIGTIAAGNPGQAAQAASMLLTIIETTTGESLRLAAVEGLGKLGLPAAPAVPQLATMFRAAKAPHEWYQLGAALARIEPAGVEALSTLLQDSRAPVELRVKACESLGRNGAARLGLDVLASALKTTSGPVQVCAARYIAGRGIDDGPALAVLREAIRTARVSQLDYSDTTERLRPSAAILLREQFTHENPERRVEAMSFLARVGARDAAAVEALTTALRDTDERVRVAAIGALSELRPPNASDAISALASIAARTAPTSAVPPPAVPGTGRDAPSRVLRTPRLVENEHELALQALGAFGPASAPAIPTLIPLVRGADPTTRRLAINVLASIGPAARVCESSLRAALEDPEPTVRIAAARGLEAIGVEPATMAPLFITAAVDDQVRRTFDQVWNDLADELRPSNLCSGAFAAGLPPFPWPPPKSTHVGLFGRDFPRAALASDDATLGEVYNRLFRALTQIDAGFESGLFAVPGGFALLTKIERVRPDGTPLEAPYRWTQGKVPPLSLVDYIGQLFFEAPGYFRVLAFVVTTESNFGFSNDPLPPFSQGGTQLPDALAAERFKDRNCYTLVYSFERRSGGNSVVVYDSPLSAQVHLTKSGLLSALAQQ